MFEGCFKERKIQFKWIILVKEDRKMVILKNKIILINGFKNGS